MTNQTVYSFTEVCHLCVTEEDFIHQAVAYTIVEPQGSQPREWQFSEEDLLALKKALRLREDLGLNLPGIALALDLKRELENTRQRLNHLEDVLAQYRPE